mmetsp:Transcript_28400/g.70953  ORF Transcript_28400/g.70953 Transcript_28400/m.70953 type:complete len:83 (+) Transcript_28400:574-822(+)
MSTLPASHRWCCSYWSHRYTRTRIVPPLALSRVTHIQAHAHAHTPIYCLSLSCRLTDTLTHTFPALIIIMTPVAPARQKDRW